MLAQAKRKILKITPRFLLSGYHFCLASLANLIYGRPSEKLIVIGVTGTNGKTTTVNLISQMLECFGYKTGLSSTVNFKVAYQDWLNDKKMTMLGRFQTQALLRKMVTSGCEYAIIETSSQGIEQWRHIGINYDVVVFTNLTPEHIEAHGSFENYRAQKEKLFAHLVKSKRKKINGKKINKTIISNIDDPETDRLKKFKADKFLTYGFDSRCDCQGKNLKIVNGLAEFELFDEKIQTGLLGKFNAYNVLAARTVLKALNLSLQSASYCRLKGVPGRQEFINAGQDFLVLVDYAPEPEGLKKLYEALGALKKNKLIHVLGSTGGGRDKARQPILGALAAENADIVIVTNEDPYDDDPMEIINNVAQGATEKGKQENINLFKILDRKEAITKAISLAQKGDLVLLTGKGAEQAICVANGQKIPWDDRRAVLQAIKKQ